MVVFKLHQIFFIDFIDPLPLWGFYILRLPEFLEFFKPINRKVFLLKKWWLDHLKSYALLQTATIYMKTEFLYKQS